MSPAGCLSFIVRQDMRFSHFIALLVCVVGVGVSGAEVRQPAGPDKVVVSSLTIREPAAEETSFDLLTEAFFGRPEVRLFTGHSTKDWKQNYDVFSRALLSLAREKGMDDAALAECLKRIATENILNEGGEIALLPISAHRGKLDGKECWFVLLLWEYPEPITVEFVPPAAPGDLPTEVPLETPRWPAVGHVRVIAYDLLERDFIAFATCD